MKPNEADRSAQQWFSSERWQKLEREADADIEAGRTASFESMDDFLADLESESLAAAPTEV